MTYTISRAAYGVQTEDRGQAVRDAPRSLRSSSGADDQTCAGVSADQSIQAAQLIRGSAQLSNDRSRARSKCECERRSRRCSTARRARRGEPTHLVDNCGAHTRRARRLTTTRQRWRGRASQADPLRCAARDQRKVRNAGTAPGVARRLASHDSTRRRRRAASRARKTTQSPQYAREDRCSALHRRSTPLKSPASAGLAGRRALVSARGDASSRG